MFRYIVSIFFTLFLSFKVHAYDYQYKTDNSSIYLKFNGESIEEIKFEFTKNNQKNFGLINYSKDEININLNGTDYRGFIKRINRKNLYLTIII